jgi:hypothetical protein
MTLRAIGEFLAERASRQFDIPFIRQMEDSAVFWRARLLTDTIERNPSKKAFFSQAILLELKDVDREDREEECAVECEELEECGCESIKRTLQKVPHSLKVGVNPFDYVGSPGGAHAFSYTTFGSEKYKLRAEINAKKPRYTFINDYIYVFNEPNLEELRVESVFGDPRQLYDYKCPGQNTPCYTATSDFPVDEKTIQMIIEYIMKTELRIPVVEEKTEIKADQNV